MPKFLKRKGKKNLFKEEKKGKTLFQSPKGMHDILPSEQPWWDKLRKVSQEVANFYNFSRIDTPILESVEIFERGTGMTTDIVEKEMFTLRTKGGDRLALRPENTPGIVRAYFEHGLSRLSQPLKLYYFGPFFRYQQPQFGRFRQFHQIGFEILGGEDDTIYDAQIILATFRLIEELKIKKPVVQINSLGCKNCRTVYRRKLQDYYRKLSNKICKDCRRRLSLNPLRLLDCKNENCQIIRSRAPIMLDYLCQSCRNHFRSVLEYLDDLNIPYTLNSYLVRGLDYYNRTVFELFSEGYTIALAGGGRYDYLGEMIGARKSSLPAVGCALGVEAIIEVMKAQGIGGLPRVKAKVFLVQIGKPAKKMAFCLIEAFRSAGIKIIESLGKESLKAQLKLADREEVEIALILGQREVFEESIIIRDMKSGAQETVPLSKVVEEIKKRLK
jgi:histidyl-tRNA synthetase